MTNHNSDERARFEAWAWAHTRMPICRDPDNFYSSASTRVAWAAWQAALRDREARG